MELTEKNGHASIEEILASVRRIIAEEPHGSAPVIDLGKPAQFPRGDGLLDDPSDFDLPSIFKTQPQGASDKPAPLFGRLSEAIRAASTGNSQGGDRVTDQSLSALKLNRLEPAETVASPHFLLSTFHDATAPRADELVAAAESDMMHAPAPSFVATSTTATLSTNVEPAPLMASADPPAPVSPQVPRQMVAFKDTRFRGMGAPVESPAFPAAISPFEEAATAALVSAADTALASHHADPIAERNPAAAPVVEELVAVAAPESLTAAIVASYPELAIEPVLVDTATRVPPPVPVHAAPSAPSPAVASAPIEDSTADLLRPMLRQWLAENMPRMVEKALHIEVAESVRSNKR